MKGNPEQPGPSIRAPHTARFTRFAVADWSGAKGSSHKGIALALCEAGRAAPVLVPPPGRAWSREAIAAWVEAEAHTPLLIGFDFSFAPPLIERGAYLPGEGAAVPAEAKNFWAYVAARCAEEDPDLGAASFLERTHRFLFRRRRWPEGGLYASAPMRGAF